MSPAEWVAVALVGGAGAVARHRVSTAVQRRAAGGRPVGTLAVNVSGSFALGVLTGLSVTGTALLLAGTALLGAYTTFSTWVVEVHRAGEVGPGEAAIWLLLPTAAGLAAGAAGWALGALL